MNDAELKYMQMERDYAVMHETLTRTQKRCTELLEEKRSLEAERDLLIGALGILEKDVKRKMEERDALAAVVEKAQHHHEAVVAYVRDRAEQYVNSSGSKCALEELAVQLQAGEYIKSFEAGELDDLIAKPMKTPKWSVNRSLNEKKDG